MVPHPVAQALVARRGSGDIGYGDGQAPLEKIAQLRVAWNAPLPYIVDLALDSTPIAIGDESSSGNALRQEPIELQEPTVEIGGRVDPRFYIASIIEAADDAVEDLAELVYPVLQCPHSLDVADA